MYAAVVPELGKNDPAKFDEYAANYRTLVAGNIAVTGEPPEYFVRYKVQCLERLGIGRREPLLDFGCGIGSLLAALAETFEAVQGFDPSAKSIEVARGRVPHVPLYSDLSKVPDAFYQTAVLSGVLHHINPSERDQVLQSVYQKLAPGGRVVIFEHNPRNPLTRRAVETCPFDDDAILLPASELVERLSKARFANTRLDYIVFFPKAMARLRPLEPHLRWLSLGAQTMTIGVKPA